MGNYVVRDIHFDVTMSNAVAMCIYHGITMHNAVAMNLLKYIISIFCFMPNCVILL